MLERIISYSLKNQFIILVLTLAGVAWGLYSLKTLPLDAIPDLSDVQVIVFTEYPGQAPQTVEDQVTYPICSKLLGVPYAKYVRGYSFFGFSFVYVIFEDGTDLYWARSRVLEYLNGLQGQLPEGVTPVLGPDATGVGWAFMYALKSDRYDLWQLRTWQDWYIRYQLLAVEGVSEVASVGGYVKQYQVAVDPNRLRAYGIRLTDVIAAVRDSTGEIGGRTLEMAEREYLIRVKGYVQSVEDLKQTTVGVGPDGTPILLSQVADVRLGPEIRRGIAELDGQGEVVGGIVVVRWGANAYEVIQRVKQKLEQVSRSLPEGVDIVVTYDRSELIRRSVETLEHKLIEESIVVAAVCLLFLFHVRSALVAVVFLPTAILLAIGAMRIQGITSNIMSLGGIAVAIGAMVDAIIIMIENTHKHLEHQDNKPRFEKIREACIEVGPALFYSLLVITVSFLPIFALQAQEGRLFKPLAFTKTYSMAAACLLSITLAPILIGWFVRGKIRPESANPLNRLLIRLYRPLFFAAVKHARTVIVTAALVFAWTIFPWDRLLVERLPDGRWRNLASKLSALFPLQNIGSEFMPPLYEGDLLYMPTTFPGISITKAKELLQQTDKIIASFPEVETVFGKIGRAETATDPAPLTMVETTIKLKPEEEWPEVDILDEQGRVVAHRRRTPEELVRDLNRAVKFPGLANAWTMPIKTRIDMLSTGIKTPVGIKIAGPDLNTLQRIAEQVEAVVRRVPHTASAFAERVMGATYIEIEPDRAQLARYGLQVADLHRALGIALGGMPLAVTVEGPERYSINIRYLRDYRNDLEALAREVLVPTPLGVEIPLGQLARLKIVDGPPVIKSESALPNAWVYVDIAGIDVGSYLKQAIATVNRAIEQGEIELPPGYFLTWSGQYEYMQRAKRTLLMVIPLTLLLIVLIIHANTKSWVKTAIVMLAVPMSLIGCFWLMYLLKYHFSVAVWVGIIALAGVDAETGVVMLLYLDLAYEQAKKKGLLTSMAALIDALYHGAVMRVRPKIMTASVIIAGLLPILWSHGTGADVMKRIAAPMVGGIVSSVFLELVVYPSIYLLWKRWELRREGVDV